MNNRQHTVIWIDHHEARVFQLDADEANEAKIHSSQPHVHLHHKANSRGSGHAPLDVDFLEHVSKAIEHAGAILIGGPAGAKTELMTHLKKHHPQLAERVSAVQTLDHPTDGELLAHARKFFKADDRMH